MDLGYVRIATYTPEIRVADVDFNLESIKKGIDNAISSNAKVLVLPELCITGSTAGDLFFSKTLSSKAKYALKEIALYTEGKNILVFVGLPFVKDGLIYNVCAGILDGTVLGIVPKSYINESDDFAQKRFFAVADEQISYVSIDEIYDEDDLIPFGANIIFADSKNYSLKISALIGEDSKALGLRLATLASNGTRIFVNLCADAEFSQNITERRNNAQSLSKNYACAYACSNAGDGESTTDCVFSGHSVISENGEIVAESVPFENGLTVADVDLDAIDFVRAKNFINKSSGDCMFVGFCLDNNDSVCARKYNKTPFINLGEEEFLIEIAAQGLKKRLIHTNAQKVVIGISGGLDSTLALIIAARAMQLVGKSSKDIISVTMPCFGTSSRTFDNSVKLAKAFDTTLKKIDITKAVQRHLKDISHAEDLHDAAYENAQARERTQVLMDLANSCNGLVVGTGDLSELALGWATYNGDHMSMYAVNASVPKTLVKHLVRYTAEKGKGKLKATLLDILDTPVSPELIPSGDDSIKQVTEDIVGPYVLHDFFLYMMIKKGFTPRKIYFSAINTFEGEFDKETILKWLKTFVRRFFNQQFKRSCLPDGVKVSEISLSPRGGLKMPSDAVSKIWLEELENI